MVNRLSRWTQMTINVRRSNLWTTVRAARLDTISSRTSFISFNILCCASVQCFEKLYTSKHTAAFKLNQATMAMNNLLINILPTIWLTLCKTPVKYIIKIWTNSILDNRFKIFISSFIQYRCADRFNGNSLFQGIQLISSIAQFCNWRVFYLFVQK